MPKHYKKNCDQCGKYYEGTARRCCSLKCSYLYRSEHPNEGNFKKGHKLNLKPILLKDCLFCNKTFEVSRNNPATKYCCHKCSVENLITGKSKSKETKIKMSLNNAHYWADRKMTDEHIKKMTVGLNPYQSGENHWNWKGGITPFLRKLRCVKKYSIWRKAVYERDNYTCQLCSKRGGKLQADHVIPFAKLIYEKNWKLLWNTKNGRTLCVECHRKVDTYAGKFRPK